jgi:hypothetical protein
MILVFLVFTLLFWFGIQAVLYSKGTRWQLTKTLGYSILCAILALSILILIVILF